MGMVLSLLAGCGGQNKRTADSRPRITKAAAKQPAGTMVMDILESAQ